MAKPTTLKWSKLSIWPGDGADPEDFTAKVCGLNSKGISFSSDVAESNIPDCTDPDLASWTERVVRALSAGVTGSGLLAEETFAFWRDWALSTNPKNVRIVIDLATTPGYFHGSFVLTAFEISGSEADGKIGVSLTLSSDGPVGWTAGAP